MPEIGPEPELPPAAVVTPLAETDWDGSRDTPAGPNLSANWVGGAAIRRSRVRGRFQIFVVLELMLVVCLVGFAVVRSPFRTAPTSSGVQATPIGAPAGVPNVTIGDAGKMRIEDVLIGGGCKISLSCTASVAGTAITHGIQISASTPAVLRLDGRYDVLRAALYIDSNSTPGGMFTVMDVSDPDLPLKEGAFQFSQPLQVGGFQMPISSHAQQISLSVNAGTIDLVGYVEGSGS